jgi:uncharacterized membrane protein
MEKRSQSNPLSILALVGVLAYLDYETNGGKNIALAIEWYQWLRTLDLITTPAEIATQQASTQNAVTSSGLSAIAQIAILLGFLAVGVVIVSIFGISRSRNKEATVAKMVTTAKVTGLIRQPRSKGLLGQGEFLE